MIRAAAPAHSRGGRGRPASKLPAAGNVSAPQAPSRPETPMAYYSSYPETVLPGARPSSRRVPRLVCGLLALFVLLETAHGAGWLEVPDGPHVCLERPTKAQVEAAIARLGHARQVESVEMGAECPFATYAAVQPMRWIWE